MKLTVLFADIRSFTSLSENLTPVENFNFLNSYLSRISPVIRRNKGFIDKYLGDGVMALFPRSPEDAVNAGLELLETVRIFNGHRANSGYRPIAISIGVNTGNLMLGTVGESSRMDGTVISDAVNLASRLEGLTRTFGAWIIVSGDLLAACPAVTRIPHRYLGRVRVKGKSRAVRIYEIIDRPDEGRVRTREAFEQALRSLEGRKYSEAARGFESVVAGDPSDPAARYYLKRLGAVTPPA
jgi:two-component system sensor histidine kinase ChiS